MRSNNEITRGTPCSPCFLISSVVYGPYPPIFQIFIALSITDRPKLTNTVMRSSKRVRMITHRAFQVCCDCIASKYSLLISANFGSYTRLNCFRLQTNRKKEYNREHGGRVARRHPLCLSINCMSFPMMVTRHTSLCSPCAFMICSSHSMKARSESIISSIKRLRSGMPRS